MQNLIVKKYGSPEVLELQSVELPQPSAGEALVRNQAIGVNFVDLQHRAGLYYLVDLPFVPGTEAAGVIESVGAGVAEFKPGDRVAFAGYMGGVYAEYTVVPVSQLVSVPATLDFKIAAAGLMQGMTAHALIYEIYPLKPGDTVLVHAAGSGVGSYLTQLARRCGATVIGTVSSVEKARIALEMGAQHVINYVEQDFEAEVLRLTNNEGVRVVYDGVSGATFEKGLNVLARRGYMVVYGQSGGQAAPLDITRLSGITGQGRYGSLFLTWATLNDYNFRREDLVRRAATVLGWLAEGSLKANISATFPLTEAVAAHRYLESRQVAGKIVLLP